MVKQFVSPGRSETAKRQKQNEYYVIGPQILQELLQFTLITTCPHPDAVNIISLFLLMQIGLFSRRSNEITKKKKWYIGHTTWFIVRMKNCTLITSRDTTWKNDP